MFLLATIHLGGGPSFPGLLTSKDQNKTYNSGYSPVVTHRSTNPPLLGLSIRERTGSTIVLEV